MTRATLGGVTLVGDSSISWTLTDGVKPFSADFTVLPGDDDKLTAKLVPVDLVIGPATFANVYVIEKVPHPNPNLRRVRVVDRRWFWSFRQVRRAFNVRRKAGTKRLSSPQVPDDVAPIVQTVQYAPWSMRAFANAWQPPEVLNEVLQLALKAEKDTTGKSPKLDVSALSKALKNIPVENLSMQCDAATAVATVLDYLPGVGLFVDAKGDVRLYRKADGSESTMLGQAAGDPKVGGGTVRPIDLSLVRPSEVRVHFVRECELRFKYVERAPGATTDVGSAAEPAMELENVIPVTDSVLYVSGEPKCAGSWITVQKALSSWGAAPFLGGKARRELSISDVCRGLAPYGGLEEALALVGTASPDANWAARAMALRQHFRRTYRIPKAWMDRIFRLRATRVGTLDSVTAARGVAGVWSDFSYLASRRSIVCAASGFGDMSYVTNVPVYDGGNLPIQAVMSPFTVEIVDEDQGIIRVTPRGDFAGVYQSVLPSCVELQGDNTSPGRKPSNAGPTGDLVAKAQGRSNAWGLRDVSEKPSQLTANYRMALIVTAQPGMGGETDPGGGHAPLQFSVVTVKPKDVPAFSGQAKCLGPRLDVIIGAGVETARIFWTDAMEGPIAAVFNAKLTGAPLDANTMNLNASIDSDAKAGGASCTAIAVAAAARIYHSLADRQQGSQVGDLVPGLEPAGTLSSVKHSLETTGELATALSLPERVEPFALEAFLPASMTRVIHHLANPGG